MWDEIFGKEPDRPIDWADAKQVQEAIAAANSGFNAAYQAGGAAQQAAIYNYNMQALNAQAAQQIQQRAQHMKQRTWGLKWMWNGEPCTIEQFAEAAYGDTPERTHFLLKYKGRDQ